MPKFSRLAFALLAACVAVPTQAAGAACPFATTKDGSSVVWSGQVTVAHYVDDEGQGVIKIVPAGCTQPANDWAWVIGKPQVFGGTAGRCKKGATAEVRGKFFALDALWDDPNEIKATEIRCR